MIFRTKRMRINRLWIFAVAVETTLACLMTSCGAMNKSYLIEDYGIKLKAPSSWEQTDAANYDLHLMCEDKTINAGFFGYTDDELGEDMTVAEMFDMQNKIALEHCENIKCIEQVTQADISGGILLQALFSAEKDGFENSYLFCLYDIDDSDKMLWGAFIGSADAVSANREAASDIMSSAKAAD